MFDRPAGSERDLVVLAACHGRHDRAAPPVRRRSAWSAAFGVLRWDGLRWHHEPPVPAWIDAVAACGHHGDRDGARDAARVRGARPRRPRASARSSSTGPTTSPAPRSRSGCRRRRRCASRRPADLAPLRHVLAQIDGAAVFDADGRAAPARRAAGAERRGRGRRRRASAACATPSGRRYSFDDPAATVIVVSEDGPVTVLRNGELIGRSETLGPAEADDSPEAQLIREDLLREGMLRS